MKRIEELKRKFESAERIQFVRSGEDFFTVLLQLIDNAQTVIHFQTYIYGDDETGNMVADALIKSAKRGVAVYLLLDSFGAGSLPDAFIENLKTAGIKVRFFSPIISSKGFQLGRRLHHKVTVADRKTCLIGGINIDNKYRGTPDKTAWLDFALLVNGAVCNKVHEVCEQIWDKNKRRIRKLFFKRKK